MTREVPDSIRVQYEMAGAAVEKAQVALDDANELLSRAESVQNAYLLGVHHGSKSDATRKTIETAADLEAMPYETVVREVIENGHGYVWEKRGDWVAVTRTMLERDRIPRPSLPVIVLFDPTTEKENR